MALSSPSKPLAGRAALITGGARRIGRALALRFAQSGAEVAITYRNSSQDAAETVAELEAFGVRALAIECDVRDESEVRDAVASVARSLGRIDVLVNNAAVFETTPFAELTLDQWDRTFATNTRGPFLFAREALPHLRFTQGRILNIGSLGGVKPWPTHVDYCASKAALHMLTQTMAKAFAPEVTVNAIAPGWIDFGEPETAHFAAKTPMRRGGQADEVADAAMFFVAGPRYVTGQILGVDGGLGL